jgi:hypothetical protein
MGEDIRLTRRRAFSGFCSWTSEERNGEVMKKVSLAGLILGIVLGIIVGLLSGTWLLWLGLGLAIGVVVGSAQARRGQLRDTNVGRMQIHER